MKTKLTLTIDEDILEKGKRYVKEQGISISSFLEGSIRAVLQPKDENAEGSDFINSIPKNYGIPDDFDWKAEKAERLAKKYL